MNCLIRPFASTHSSGPLRSSLSFAVAATRFPLLSSRKKQPRTLFTHSSLIEPRKAPSFCNTAHRRRLTAVPPSMDLDPTERDPPLPEDFVNVENPDPAFGDSLSESIVKVEHEPGNDEGKDGVTAIEEFGSPERIKVALPEELSRSVMVLTCESLAEGGTCDVYLVGTAHVSQESCQEVETVISCLKPQAVFLELCSSRVAVLTPQSLKVPTLREMVDMYKNKHNLFGILYSWFLAKVAHKLEVFPGSEFRVAFQEAMKYGGKVILGDRPVQITLLRTWVKMPLWHKVKLLYSMLFQAVFLPSAEDLNKMLKDMGDVDMLTLVIQEMSKEFPTLMETLVHERDQYMSSSLLRVARENSSVVAVVGKGHLQGIKKHWQQPISVKDLMEIPSKKPAFSVGTILASLGAAAAGVAIVSGLYFSMKK